jgi:hypothetical protein
MWKRTALLAAVLAIALPAFADTPETVNKAAKAPVSKAPARKPWAKGTEVHSFGQKVQAPVDNNSTGPVGKRKHKPANPGNNGTLVKENVAPPK